MTAVATVSLMASFGRFASPLWWLRWLAWFATALGPHDPLFGLPRPDEYLEDGAGSPYAILAAVLPGFGLFRYSSKLLTFTAAAVAVLAGSGWDDAMAGRSQWLARTSALGLAASAAALGLATALRTGRRTAVESDPVRCADRSHRCPRARSRRRRPRHGVLIYALGLGLALRGPRRRSAPVPSSWWLLRSTWD